MRKKRKYDKHYNRVFKEVSKNGWSNLDKLPNVFKELISDTIKATKRVIEKAL